MTFKSLDDFLKRKPARGCSEEEVAALESEFNVTFPPDYREFLLRGGKGIDDLWVGSDYTLEELPGNQEAAVELLEEENLKMPENSFVVMMHQGYQFFLLNNEGIFFFDEGIEELKKCRNTFEEIFADTCDTL